MPRKHLPKQYSVDGSHDLQRDSVTVNMTNAHVVISDHEKSHVQNKIFEELSQLKPAELVEEGRLADLKVLVRDVGLNLTGRLEDGATLLHLAVEKNQLETAEYLMDKGVDVNAVNNKGKC